MLNTHLQTWPVAENEFLAQMNVAAISIRSSGVPVIVSKITEFVMEYCEKIRVFIRIADMASFTRAAESLGIQKGRASAVVRELEAELGTRLLHRTTRAVRLTDEGRAYCERATNMLAEFDDLQHMFHDLHRNVSGRLRVDLPANMVSEIVMPALSTFIKAHPNLKFEISGTDRRVDVVKEGFDCVLRVGAIGDDSLVARRLGELRMLNAASPAYLASYGAPSSLEDLLKNHTIIHYSATLGARPYCWEYFDGKHNQAFAVPGAIQLNNVAAYEAAGVAGLGLIQAPLADIGRHIKSGALVEILPDFPPPPLPVWFIVGHSRNIPKRVRIFMEWMEKTLAPFMT